ncbi:HNH endonuclease [Lactococcus phage GE1]|uniref:HNH endonuclease n=1 Tax=Lactococcus phage GE1 TaxID=1698369 RepID=A0A0N9BAU5_9CAUD|nr:HNH endonuclease [Lactococcus phage GE1]ALA06963.1 HNH endonuclease [Lactococcus phage GE1]
MRSFIKYKENYVVSDHGEIWKITKAGLRKTKGTTDKDGYKVISINNKNKKVHRVVLEAFKGVSSLTADHIDRNKSNNKLDNLEYVTQKENSKRALSKRIEYRGELYRDSIELAKALNLTSSAVRNAINYNRKLKGFEVKRA